MMWQVNNGARNREQRGGVRPDYKHLKGPLRMSDRFFVRPDTLYTNVLYVLLGLLSEEVIMK